MKNYSGVKECDIGIIEELNEAGIKIQSFGFVSKSEVPASLFGQLENWTFKRAWCYWVASGDCIPKNVAIKLHESYKDTIRPYGDASIYTDEFPKEGVNYYHIDTQEGLNILANTIRQLNTIKDLFFQ